MHDTGLQFALIFYVLPLGMAAVIALGLYAFPALWAVTVRNTDATRNHTMDGARGLLTLWVLTFHVHQVPWIVDPGFHPSLPPGRLSAMLSTGFFVAPFFAMTAMLFGGVLLSSRGQLATIRFLRRRFFRIVPGYAVSVLIIVVAAFWISGFRLQVPLGSLVKELGRWSLFDFVKRYDINGVDLAAAHAMLWTLSYEIGFYLVLPILAWAQRRTGSPAAPFFLLAGMAAIWWPFTFFAGGIAAAALVGWRHRHAEMVLQVASVVAILLLIGLAYHSIVAVQAALLAPILAAVARETWLFRWLRLRPLRYVGEISYSVYILHYPLLWIAFLAIGGPGPMASMDIAGRWVALIGCGVIVLAVATLCYIFVERPFTAFGKELEGRQAPVPPSPDTMTGREAGFAPALPHSRLSSRRPEA